MQKKAPSPLKKTVPAKQIKAPETKKEIFFSTSERPGTLIIVE